jgi:predicted hydrocarbon binding protein
MTQDFERFWLSKLSVCIEHAAGSEIRDRIMEGSENLSDNTEKNRIVEWSAKAMTLLDEHVKADKRVEIMTGCACQYPKVELREIRKKYEETKDVDVVLEMLQEKFISFLRGRLNLDTNIIEVIVQKKWGLAGYRDGNRVITTKIPKSGYIQEYLEEKNPTKKRAIYCHCPRIREALNNVAEISPTYCYCGAGYYKGIWEEILQKQVVVVLLKSVLKGDDVCSIAVHLPQEKR